MRDGFGSGACFGDMFSVSRYVKFMGTGELRCFALVDVYLTNASNSRHPGNRGLYSGGTLGSELKRIG